MTTLGFINDHIAEGLNQEKLSMRIQIVQLDLTDAFEIVYHSVSKSKR